MADKTYIQFTGRLKATSQEGILAEAQQIAISGSDNTNVKKYIDDKISSVNNNIGSVAGSVYRPKGSITFAGLKALTSATAGDVYNVTDAFMLGSKSYPAGSNVACLKSFSSAVTPSETYWDVLAGFVDLSPYAKTSEVNTIKGNLEKSISDNVSTLTTKVGTAQTTANAAKSAASTNAGEITKVKNRVSSLEGVGAQANVIESVKVNGSALAVANKAVNIDLSSYAKGSDVNSLKTKTKKFVVLPFTFGIEVGTPTFESSSITINGETTVYYSKAGKTFYVQSNMKNYKSWANSAGFPGKVEYNDENILFIETTTKGLYMKTADGLVFCNQSLVSGYATTSALKAAENRITALENLLKLA